MGSIIKRDSGKWWARVRVAGYPPQSRTFELKKDAERWITATERELETSGFIDRREADKTTLRTILKRYSDEVTPSKKSKDFETIKIGMLLADKALADLKMSAISSSAVAAWRDRRAKKVGAATIIRELGILSAVLNHARREWGIHVENPIRYVKRPSAPRARDRRLSNEEEHYLLKALSEAPRKADGTFGSGGSRNPWLASLIGLALETAMRRGELLALEWQHVDLKRRVAHLPDTKNGEARNVPLSSRAAEILSDMPRAITGTVFPITPMAVKMGFAHAIKRAQAAYRKDCEEASNTPAPSFLVDLHFHDLRHEATSRMADKLPNLIELSAVTGHKDLRMLKRYYHPKAEDLAKKLG